MIRVRFATADDLLSLFKMAVHMHGETEFGNIELNPEKLLSGLAGWISNAVILIAEKDGEIVGMLCASMKTCWFSDKTFASEDLFYVAPEHRGSRAGYMLMKALLAWGEEQGAHHCAAGVATGTGEGAERLYKHFGMKHVGGNYVTYYARD